jgi:hypothetical protein
MTSPVRTRKEVELERLLALGYEPHELTWVEGSVGGVRLVHLAGEDPTQVKEDWLDKLLQGEWTISHAGVERMIRKMPGCENYSVDEALQALYESPFLRVTDFDPVEKP